MYMTSTLGTVDDDLYTMYVHTTPDTYTLSECIYVWAMNIDPILREIK